MQAALHSRVLQRLLTVIVQSNRSTLSLGKQGFLASNSLTTVCMLLSVFVLFPEYFMQRALAEQPRVNISTSLGNIVVELDADESPLGVANFLKYVDDGSYVGTIFHRVIPDFLVQAGGYRVDLSDIEKGDMIVNEADNGLFNIAGTIAYARNDEIDSAGRQFFINTRDNASLDHSPESCSRKDEKSRLRALERGLNKPQTCQTFGYAVFGHVVSGMAVVVTMSEVPTSFKGDMADLPDIPITINAMTRLKAVTVESK
jgi:cyclophilin family peptidyl-prolyl cis-trans isomerase